MFKLSANQLPYRWLLPIPIVLVLYACIKAPSIDLIKQLIVLVTTHSPGIHDYSVTAGYAATMLNAGLIGLAVMGLLKLNKLPMNANSISTLFIMMGFSFIGKNIINFIPFVIGGYLYSRFQHISFKRIIVASLLSSCLAPLIDFVLKTLSYDFSIEYAVSVGLGVLVGLIAVPVSSHILLTHQGYNLYNMGYAAGFIGIIIVSVFKSFGLEVENLSIISDTGDPGLLWLVLAMCLYLIVLGLNSRSELDKPYRQIYFCSGRLVTDFTRLVGPGTTLINMGIMGFIGLSFVVVFKVEATGPIMAGLFTLIGFSSFGNHPKNTLPIMIGAIFGILFVNHNLSISSGMIAVLFSTTLAPIAGEYGVFTGLAVGVLHTMMVSSMAGLHAGMNLYNNGFSGGIIATLVVPVLAAYKKES